MRLDIRISLDLKISRSYAGNLIKKGLVIVNGNICTQKDYIVKNPDIISVTEREINIRVLYENKDFAIVYKPYDISVCRTFNTPKNEKVLNEELLKYMELSRTPKEREFGLVHRLDKLTEGLILIAKNEYFYMYISELFRQKKIKKKYLAFYEKKDINLLNFFYFQCEHGLFNFSIYDQKCLCEVQNYDLINLKYEEKYDRVKTSICSELFMESLARKKDGFFEFIPITGVRHQVRLSMESIGYSVYGDPIYGKKTQDRMLLYSVFLGFLY